MASNEEIAAGRAAGPGDLLRLRGLVPLHLGDADPATSQPVAFFGRLDGQAGGPESLGGRLYSDGSAKRHVVPELSLAGGAVIELGEGGAVMAAFTVLSLSECLWMPHSLLVGVL